MEKNLLGESSGDISFRLRGPPRAKLLNSPNSRKAIYRQILRINFIWNLKYPALDSRGRGDLAGPSDGKINFLISLSTFSGAKLDARYA